MKIDMNKQFVETKILPDAYRATTTGAARARAAADAEASATGAAES